MRTSRFAGSLGFAALAALLSVPGLLLLSPVLGARGALGAVLVASAAAYCGGLAERPRDRLRTGLLVAALGGVLALASPAIGVLATALAALLGVVRSGLVHRARPLRALVTEVALLGAGLVGARLVAAPDAPHVACATWAFFLVQSLFPLVRGVQPRDGRPGGEDAFEAARDRARSILEEPV
jgi:hypothetical protein